MAYEDNSYELFVLLMLSDFGALKTPIDMPGTTGYILYERASKLNNQAVTRTNAIMLMKSKGILK
jgi:hypothetical protein